MDLNIAAFLDTAAYTVDAQFTGGGKLYTYVTNIQGLKRGDFCVVHVGKLEVQHLANEDNTNTACDLANGDVRSHYREKYEMDESLIPSALPYGIGSFKIVQIVKVSKTVDIVPNDKFQYNWIAMKLDFSEFFALTRRNDEIEKMVSTSYQRNLRRNFADRVLDEMPVEERDAMLRLINPQRVVATNGDSNGSK